MGLLFFFLDTFLQVHVNTNKQLEFNGFHRYFHRIPKMQTKYVYASSMCIVQIYVGCRWTTMELFFTQCMHTFITCIYIIHTQFELFEMFWHTVCHPYTNFGIISTRVFYLFRDHFGRVRVRILIFTRNLWEKRVPRFLFGPSLALTVIFHTFPSLFFMQCWLVHHSAFIHVCVCV